MNNEMVTLFLNYSTDHLERTISAENDPVYVANVITSVFLPPGDYRVIAGSLMRVREGLPASESQAIVPAADHTSTSRMDHA